MKRTLMTLAAAAVIGTAGMAATTQSAQAAWWIAPAIVGGVLLGGVTVAAAANANNGPYGYYDSGYAPTGNVYVRPAGGEFANCRITRERVPGGYRRVQVCY